MPGRALIIDRGDYVRNSIAGSTLLISLIISVFLLCGCSNNEASKKPTAEQQKPELPSSLKSIRSELEKIIPELEQAAQIMPQELMERASGGGQEKGKEGSQQQQFEQSGEESSRQAPGKQLEPIQEEQKTMDTWAGIKESIKKIHENWNRVEAAAIKEGLSTEIRDKFENALEDLALSSDARNIEESLFAALEVYRYYPDMTELFDSRIPPEFYRLKYKVMLIRDLAGREKWDQVKAEIPSLRTQWEILKRNDAIKEHEIAGNTENSISDLKNVAGKQENYLVQIKGSIVMNNLAEVEERLNNSMQH